MSLGSWWYWFRVSSTVDTYLYHNEQEDEWKHRYVADTSELEQKQRDMILHHRNAKSRQLGRLLYDLNVPMEEEVYLGDGRVVEYRFSLLPSEDYLEIQNA